MTRTRAGLILTLAALLAFLLRCCGSAGQLSSVWSLEVANDFEECQEKLRPPPRRPSATPNQSMRPTLCRPQESRRRLRILRLHAEPDVRHCRPQPERRRTQADRSFLCRVPRYTASGNAFVGTRQTAVRSRTGHPRTISPGTVDPPPPARHGENPTSGQATARRAIESLRRRFLVVQLGKIVCGREERFCVLLSYQALGDASPAFKN